jgi:hypothetical protein
LFYLSMSSSPLAPMADINTCREKRKLQNVEFKQEKYEYSPGYKKLLFMTFITISSSHYPCFYSVDVTNWIANPHYIHEGWGCASQYPARRG